MSVKIAQLENRHRRCVRRMAIASFPNRAANLAYDDQLHVALRWAIDSSFTWGDDDLLDRSNHPVFFGVLGDETSVDVDYTHLVKPGELLMSTAGRTKSIPNGGPLLVRTEHEIVAVFGLHGSIMFP